MLWCAACSYQSSWETARSTTMMAAAGSPPPRLRESTAMTTAVAGQQSPPLSLLPRLDIRWESCLIFGYDMRRVLFQKVNWHFILRVRNTTVYTNYKWIQSKKMVSMRSSSSPDSHGFESPGRWTEGLHGVYQRSGVSNVHWVLFVP
jgi:hypothetical protein